MGFVKHSGRRLYKEGGIWIKTWRMCNREKEGGIPGKLPVWRKVEWYKSE